MAPKNPLEVTLVSGQPLEVLTLKEVQWFEETRNTYLLETKFTEATDLRDLDRVLILELMIFRWSQWLAKGKNYEGDLTDDVALQKNIKEYSVSINQVKESMGLNKKARDSGANDGNFADWLEMMKQRAKIFNVHRVKQSTEAITLINEIIHVCGTFARADEEERGKFGYKTEADIVKWINEVVTHQYNAIDEYFLETEQRFWTKD